MKKKSFRKAVAFIVVLMMTFGSMSMAYATQANTSTSSIKGEAAWSGGSIAGENTLQKSVLEVVVPTKLVTALDPFGIASPSGLTGSQIVSPHFDIINKGNTPVEATFNILVAAGADVNMVTEEAIITETSIDKDIFVGMVLAKADSTTTIGAVSGAATATNAAFLTTVAITTSATDATLPALSVRDGAQVTFLLDAATGTTNGTAGLFTPTAITTAGVGSFAFYGKMVTSPKTKWAKEDLALKATYILKPINTSVYDGKVSDKVSGLLNVLSAPAFSTVLFSYDDSDADNLTLKGEYSGVATTGSTDKNTGGNTASGFAIGLDLPASTAASTLKVQHIDPNTKKATAWPATAYTYNTTTSLLYLSTAGLAQLETAYGAGSTTDVQIVVGTSIYTIGLTVN